MMTGVKSTVQEDKYKESPFRISLLIRGEVIAYYREQLVHSLKRERISLDLLHGAEGNFFYLFMTRDMDLCPEIGTKFLYNQ